MRKGISLIVVKYIALVYPDVDSFISYVILVPVC
jgi:hypothetical protein